MLFFSLLLSVSFPHKDFRADQMFYWIMSSKPFSFLDPFMFQMLCRLDVVYFLLSLIYIFLSDLDSLARNSTSVISCLGKNSAYFMIWCIIVYNSQEKKKYDTIETPFLILYFPDLVCVRTCTHMHIHMYLHVPRDWLLISYLSQSSLYCLRQGHSLNLKLTYLATLASQQVSLSPELGLQAPSLLYGFQGSSAGLRACMKGTLLSNPSL